MTIVEVVGIGLVFFVAAVVVTARSECRTNRELLRVKREWMERMTDDTRD